MTTEQTELIEKLNCLEFETSQLNHAYQLWRSDVEQGDAPDWMANAIRITYDALITSCLNTVSALVLDARDVDEIESHADSGENAFPLRGALLAEDNITALCIHHTQRLQRDHAKTNPSTGSTAVVDGSLALTPLRQQNRIVGMLALADVPCASSPSPMAQLEAACEISGILGEASSAAEPYGELLPMTERNWSGHDMPVAISEQPAIQEGWHEEEAGAEALNMHSLATLRLPNWVRGSRRLFGAASVAIIASVAILMAAGGAMGIYMASPKRSAPRSDPRLAAVGAVAIPTGEKAGFKFDPDPAVAPPGSSFVLNAVLSRGSDIASVAAEIDYDASLLEFMGASEGGFLAKPGQQFVLAQRDDPLVGVLKINAEQSPGRPGISGEGPVFALSFRARKKGKATVSIVPSAHDSQGRRIEMAGSQVSVTVNEIAKTRKPSQEAHR